MGIFSNIELLEIVEAYAEENGGISSEEELSEMFDEQFAESIFEKYGKNDKPAFNESFNDWTDGLCKDGELHSEQYDRYCYVGKYAE